MILERAKIIDACDKIIVLSLYVVALLLPISKAVIEIFSTLAIACYILKKILQREDILKAPIDITVFVYLAICFLSIFISTNTKISARTFVGKTLQEVLFFFAVVEALKGEKRVKNFIYILLGSSLILGLDGIYQHFTRMEFLRNRPYYGLARIYTTFPTSNDFGCYLASVIPFAFACFFAKSKTRFKLSHLAFMALFALLFICLMLTISRGAWFAFLSAMLFMSIWIRSLGVSFLVLGIFIMATSQFYGPLLQERLANFFTFADTSSVDRKTIWQAALNMLRYRPLLGLGLGTFMFNFSRFLIGGYRPGLVPYAHNCYLQMSTEIGLLGLSSFLLILLLFFYNGIKAINSSDRTFFWYILLACLAAILGYCVQMAVDTTFYSLDLGILFWMLLGLGAAVMNNIKSEIAPQRGIA